MILYITGGSSCACLCTLTHPRSRPPPLECPHRIRLPSHPEDQYQLLALAAPFGAMCRFTLPVGDISWVPYVLLSAVCSYAHFFRLIQAQQERRINLPRFRFYCNLQLTFLKVHSSFYFECTDERCSTVARNPGLCNHACLCLCPHRALPMPVGWRKESRNFGDAAAAAQHLAQHSMRIWSAGRLCCAD